VNPPATSAWQEVAAAADGSLAQAPPGHRICDVAALADTPPAAIQTAYSIPRRIHSLGSYYRADVRGIALAPGLKRELESLRPGRRCSAAS
jgi:phosphoribosylamine-glycine ligase